ncbi:MAG TPA: prepilin-type N-terminal cleavage/methylation domain-containing protein [Microthrixaceae bacterium]|nr:prepilin-type N-terminal cleavage/methylation domain-containing protein [Microthrixaceae bacterium]
MGRLLGRGGGAAGFTLLEVLIGLAVLALITVAVTAISLTGVVGIRDGAVERQLDATTAQWVSMRFARDVAGAEKVVTSDCAPPTGSDRLVTLASSTGGFVTYHSRQVSASPATYDLSRQDCSGSVTDRRIVDGLEGVAPSVTCDGGPCVDGDSPRIVRLQVTRTHRFDFELGGARRTTGSDLADGPLEAPAFLSLGGGTPLEVGGNSQLVIDGHAYVNGPSPGQVAVNLHGGAGEPLKLNVSGEFAIERESQCSGCADKANKVPGTFDQRLPDPLRFLPPPEVAGAGSCQFQDGVNVCHPGVYTEEFPPSVSGAGGVKDYVLLPGVYALDAGLKVTNGSLAGDGVLLFNRSGTISVHGADLQLSPPASGAYSGILVFQARTNTAKITINGNAVLASLAGTIYAPASQGVVLGGGNGTLRIGRVIAENLEVSGNGTVIVSG